MKQHGQISLQVLMISVVGITLIVGFTMWASAYVKSVGRDVNKSQAFTIAEAGIEYYRWHLAHAPQDFYDGQGASSTGPYIHPYYDKNGNHIGEFDLVITPPASGTTIVAVQSTGLVDSDPTISKIIKVKMGLPSFARYSVAANANMRFGPGTVIYGQIQSNGGIHFDGTAYNSISSALTTYVDPDTNVNNWAVYTQVSPADPSPPTALPVRTDVFKAGRQLGVPAIDFNGITQNLANMKLAAQSASGYYLGPSNKYGYDIVLKTTGKFDVYKVTALTAAPSGCTTDGSFQWGTWSIASETSVSTNVSFPANGIIFVEDDLWIRGQINGARLDIGAGRFPVSQSTYANITTNTNLLYSHYDGTDALGLIAQNNVNVGLMSDDTFEVDGAIIAQNGRVGRYYYYPGCGSTYKRTQISLYGMLGTNQRYGWAYTDGTGYQNRVITYDANLLYGPPPSFPITGSQYDIISWDEVK